MSARRKTVTARAPVTGKPMSPQPDPAPHHDDGAEQRVRSELRDGSPGPIRLADRSKARDGLLCWTADVGKGCPAFVRCEPCPEDREAKS